MIHFSKNLHLKKPIKYPKKRLFLMNMRSTTSLLNNYVLCVVKKSHDKSNVTSSDFIQVGSFYS
ncbi:hypothetical protein SAMN06269250_3752 [Spirosoma fluviale]|uniref:Uncharacterized protein n=1 Tax=Spirosoma fluviale TaxID=1597977 RepID=A0A286G910_9BACT|nr:hypothetical protein SAMN06269250_3752 [Spirosoma fluviale]